MDAQVAHVVHTTGPAVIHRLVLEAAARFDPEATEVTECDTKSKLCFDLDLDTPATSVGKASAVSAYGLLDRADAEDLEAAIRQLAHQLYLDGSTDDLAVRRAKALGYLARGQEVLPEEDAAVTGAGAGSGSGAPQDGRAASASERCRDRATDAPTAPSTTQDGRAARSASDERRRDRATDAPTAPSTTQDGRAARSASDERRRDRVSDAPTDPGTQIGAGPGTKTPRRTVILTVHLSDAALTGAPQIDPVTGKLGLNLARVENHRQLVTADAVREWCGTPGTQVIVKPVIDLHDTVAVSSYEVPDRIAARVKLTRTTCAFPHCTRPAESADLDHTIEYLPPDRGGPPDQTSTNNLAPLCRHDHRAKTHPSPAGSGVQQSGVRRT